MRRYLDGRRGWTTVTTLLSLLVTLVTAQVAGIGTASATTPVGEPQPAVVQPTTRTAAVVTPGTTAAPGVPGRERPAGTLASTASAAPAAAPAGVAPAVPAATPAALCSGPGWEQRRGQAALASLGPAATASGFAVVFRPARGDVLGLTHLKDRFVEVFVRDCGAETDALLRHVLGHELGHAYDTARMTDATRTAYQAARAIPAGVPWYGCSGCADFATPAGDFAETFSQWLRGAPTSLSTVAPAAGPAALQAIGARFFGG